MLVQGFELFDGYGHHAEVVVAISLQRVRGRNPNTFSRLRAIMSVQLIQWRRGNKKTRIKSSRSARWRDPAVEIVDLINREG